ncbi:uncharacterized protein LOC105206713 isoform X2 [Solenopsis invicta]|uniref:uncharacterized protein LOC105206713 isoform X2 n=1 Tax=Solenopsis invicta TaxID=13686 RepID=UPI00193D01AB|nr:uncharacterized protein LOC105206713 isoform X2 [Solenopsis invicta]
MFIFLRKIFYVRNENVLYFNIIFSWTLDMAFATSLLNAATKDKELTEKTTIEPDLTQQITETNTETSAETETENQNDDTGSLYRWSTAAVLLLLDTYKTFEDKFSSGKCSQKKIWEEISDVLAEKGHMITGPQCAAKLRSLKKSYKSVKDHNSRSGSDRRTWQFYEIMDEIFSKRAWCSPIAVASSTGLSIKQDKGPTSDSSTENLVLKERSLNRKESSTSKENICNILKKRLIQKNEQEEAKAKRHKERMEMDEKFLQILTKISEKQ